MSVSFNKYFTVPITAGNTTSAGITKEQYQDMADLLISAPAVLAETVKFEVGNADTEALTTVWATLQDDTATDLNGPTAGKTRVYSHLVSARIWRIKLSVGAAVDHIFHCSGQWTT